MTEEVMSFVNDNVFGVWFLIGAALVFWMQAGFAMVETGFTRAKNAGNIIMKNLMDFCIGTVMFILIGFGLLLGEDLVGLIGKPGFDIFTAYESFDWSNDDYEKASEFQKNAAVKVVEAPVAASPSGIYKVVVIAKLSRFERLKTALNDLGVTGMTMTQVMGCGIQKGAGEKYRGAEIDATLLPKVKLEVVVSKIPVEDVVETVKKTLYTGHIGDGKIFVYNVDRVVKVRTGEENYAALQDVE